MNITIWDWKLLISILGITGVLRALSLLPNAISFFKNSVTPDVELYSTSRHYSILVIWALVSTPGYVPRALSHSSRIFPCSRHPSPCLGVTALSHPNGTSSLGLDSYAPSIVISIFFFGICITRRTSSLQEITTLGLRDLVFTNLIPRNSSLSNLWELSPLS